jgi:hypothetical protein
MITRQFWLVLPYLVLWVMALSLLRICEWYRIDLPDEPQGFFAFVIRFEEWLGYSEP